MSNPHPIINGLLPPITLDRQRALARGCLSERFGQTCNVKLLVTQLLFGR